MPLTDRAEMLGVLLEASPSGIVCVDSVGNVRVWSRAAEKMLGWYEHELVGHPIPVELQSPLQCAKPADVRLRKRGGELIDVELRTAPWQDRQGGSGTLYILADIGQQRAS